VGEIWSGIAKLALYVMVSYNEVVLFVLPIIVDSLGQRNELFVGTITYSISLPRWC